MPALTKQVRWPYVVVGVGFAVLGVVFLAYGFARQRIVEAAIRRGEFAPPDERVMGVLAAVGALLGMALIALVIVND